LGVDGREQTLRDARRRPAQRFVEQDRLGHFLAHQLEPAGEFGVLRQRLLHPLAVATAQRSGRVPGKQRFNVLAVRRPLSPRNHGQPLSTPAALSSSDNLFRAYNMPGLTVASGIPTMPATSSTDFSW